MPVITCPTCKGRGRIYPNAAGARGILNDGKICPECQGEKKVMGTPSQAAAAKRQDQESPDGC